MTPPATTSEPPLLTRPFLLACAAHFFHALAFNLYLHFPRYLRGLGADELRIGAITGVMAATAIAARPALGAWMDRNGRSRAILLGGIVHVAACLLYLLVSRLGPAVWLIRVVHGVADATLFAALFALAADIVPSSRRIQGIALFGVSGMLPLSLGGLLGDAILARAPFRVLFLTAGAFAALGVLCSLVLRDAKSEASTAAPPRGFVAAIVQPDLLPIWFVGLAFASSIAGPFTFIATFVAKHEVGTVGAFFTAYSIAAIVLRVALGGLPDRVGARRVLLPALFVLAIGEVVLARAGSAASVAIAGLLCGAGHGFAFPILCALVVARARDAERGTALAIFTALFDGGLLLGAPALGAVARAFGYRPMFLVAAGTVAVATAVFAVWDAPRPAAARAA